VSSKDVCIVGTRRCVREGLDFLVEEELNQQTIAVLKGPTKEKVITS